MKTKLKSALVIAALAIVSLASLSFLPHESRAAGLGGGEQYKVLLSQGQDARAMEQQLNALARDGWKVRAATAQGFIILAK
jgi:hypothetical protein